MRLGGILQLVDRRVGNIVGMGGFVCSPGVCWSGVAWHGWVVQVSPAGAGWQCGEVGAPSGAGAGMEGGHALCWAEAVDGFGVVGPEVLLIGRLSDDGWWRAVTVGEALVGWEELSV